LDTVGAETPASCAIVAIVAGPDGPACTDLETVTPSL
jgi:hypothetical protein